MCFVIDSGIKTVEDLHNSLTRRLGPYGDTESGAGTALVYSVFSTAFTETREFLKDKINEFKTKLQFFKQTGFPDFPLGTSVFHYSTLFFIQ